MVKIKNWHLLSLIGIVSLLSLILIQQQVIAQWQDPIGLPGETTGFRILTNPLAEDVDLSGYSLFDTQNSNFVLEPGGDIGLQITGNNYAGYFNGNVKITGSLELNGSLIGGGLWQRVSDVDSRIYYNANNVGIGNNSPTHLLDLKKIDGNAELTIQSNNISNGHWGLYHDSSSDDLIFWKDTANRFVFSDAGRLSIGGLVNNYYNLSVTKSQSDDYAAQFVGGLRIIDDDTPGYSYLQLPAVYGTNPPATECSWSGKGKLAVNYEDGRLWICATTNGNPSWHYVDLIDSGITQY